MLFDLQGRRKTAVKVIYLALALLMGGGLVLFGVGSDVQGGLADIFRGGSSGDGQYQQDVEKYEKQALARPDDPATRAQLIQARFSLASSGDNVTDNGYTKNGLEILKKVTTDWTQYLESAKKIDEKTANYAVSAYAGLNEFDGAMKAQQKLAEVQDPETASAYATLAQFAIYAGDKRVAELAERKALKLSSKGQRSQLKDQLDQLRKDVVEALAKKGAVETEGAE